MLRIPLSELLSIVQESQALTLHSLREPAVSGTFTLFGRLLLSRLFRTRTYCIYTRHRLVSLPGRLVRKRIGLLHLGAVGIVSVSRSVTNSVQPGLEGLYTLMHKASEKGLCYRVFGGLRLVRSSQK